MEAHAVIGIGFGDEGKGHVVDYLCSQMPNSIVVRFSGGPQAAHQVIMEDGRDHVFAHFGSGTFRNIPTLWTKYCPMNPVALIKELGVLRDKQTDPRITIDPKCPVITPDDIQSNKMQESARMAKHGTCGVGISTTYFREKANCSLLFEDLFHPTVLKIKIQMVEQFYRTVVPWELDYSEFFEACEKIRKSKNIYCLPAYPDWGKRVIFEGSQGLMLDKDIGFFPYVTPSNTGLTNILDMGYSPIINFVTRAYQTRHGNGPMSPMTPNNIRNNPYEKNTDDGPQGEFRKTLLDLDIIRYALAKDKQSVFIGKPKNIFINCLDLVKDEYRLFDGGDIIQTNDEDDFVSKIKHACMATNVYRSYTPFASGIRKDQANE